jgi:hypothetical protein
MQPAARRALDNRADPPYLKPLLIVTLAIRSAPELSICRSSPRLRVTYGPRGGPAPMTCTPRYRAALSPAPGPVPCQNSLIAVELAFRVR